MRREVYLGLVHISLKGFTTPSAILPLYLSISEENRGKVTQKQHKEKYKKKNVLNKNQ